MFVFQLYSRVHHIAQYSSTALRYASMSGLHMAFSFLFTLHELSPHQQAAITTPPHRATSEFLSPNGDWVWSKPEAMSAGISTRQPTTVNCLV